jgi:uncharacterized protein YhfF
VIASLDEVLEAVASARLIGDCSSVIIAIDGFGGSGKSTLAERVFAELPGTLVHTDDFASWDNPLEWWQRMLDQVLIPLSRNETARYQRYDWDDRALAEWHSIPAGGLVLIEGVSSSRVAFRPYLSLSIWVETRRSLRLERGIQRDGEGMRADWMNWMASEDAWAAEEDPQSHVDLTVSGESDRAITAQSLPSAEFAFPGELRDRLVAAILAGEKTSTAATLREYSVENEPLPVVGERAAVVDSDGRRVAVIETTGVAVVRLADVDLAHAIDEGEGYATVAEWRSSHVEFWESDRMRGYMGELFVPVTDDTELVLQRFRVVEVL